MTETSATFSAFVGFEGSLHLLLNFLFFLKQCVPTAAVSLSALAYELAHELAVSHLCTVRVTYMIYLAWLRSTCMHWLQHDGGMYSPFQCFANSSKATQR